MRFCIHSLPRSQSFWASQVLTTFDSICLHEPIAKGLVRRLTPAETIQSLELIPEENVGFVEHIISNQTMDGYREVVIFRPVGEVQESLRKVGIEVTRAELEGLEGLLRKKAEEPGVLVLHHPVEKEEDVVKLFCHCLGRKPTKSELRKASAKIYLPRRQVEKNLKKVKELSC